MSSDWNIINAEIITWASAYEGPRYHHIISDPPYALEFLNLGWDKPQSGSGNLSQMQQYQQWVSEWSEALIANVLHPGATCAFFGGARTFHRLTAGLEDGGFEIFDVMMWLYGQGMAKGQDISKAMDGAAFKEWLNGLDHGLTPAEKRLVISAAMQGGISMEERHDLGRSKMARGVALLNDLINRHWNGPAGTLPPGVRVKVGERKETSGYKSINGNNASIGYRPADYYADKSDTLPIALPSTEAAQAWQGYNTGLKPAWEPVVLCRAPKHGRTYVYLAQNYGAGPINIDAGRIAVEDNAGGTWGSSNEACQSGFNGSSAGIAYRSQQHPAGRWPANLALAHVPGEICPHCAGTGQVGWEQWYGRTKAYGGSREEWERLAGGAETIECGQCHGHGEIGGCQPRCLTSIKGITGTLNGSWRRGHQKNGDYSGADETDLGRAIGYANADGTETGEAWACVCGCDDCGTEWPAESLTDCPACGSDNTGWRCPVRLLDDQAGELKSGNNNVRRGDREKGWGGWSDKLVGTARVSYGDSGTASRFFYVAKVSPWEGSAGCEDLYWRSDSESPTGYRSVNKAEWETLPNHRRKHGNIHPTRKPIRLIEYLARILLAPRHIKPRVCIPFFGSGSEGAGTLLAAKSLGVAVEITGIENEAEYCRVAEKRLSFWENADSYETARRKPLGRQAESPVVGSEASVAVQTSFLGGGN